MTMAVSTNGRIIAAAGLAIAAHTFVSAPGALQSFLLGFQFAVVLFAFLL